jgi:hypothetical protein
MPESDHGSVSSRDVRRLTFEEFLHLSDKLRRAERLLPYEVRALEEQEHAERHLTRRALVQRRPMPLRR